MFVGADVETFKITRARLAPRLVCLTHARSEGSNFREEILARVDGAAGWFEGEVADPSVVLVIFNAPFDVGVICNESPQIIPGVFDAYRAGRIRCPSSRQKLIDIARGERKFRRTRRPDGSIAVVKSKYNLADIVAHYFGEAVEKKDTWRKSYALLDGLPASQYPPSARKYAMHDSRWHLLVYEAQDRLIAEKWGELPNQIEQQISAFALHLMSAWGIRADARAVERFIDHCCEEIRKMQDALCDTGIFKMKYRCSGKCRHEANAPWSVCPRCAASRCRENPDAGKRTMAEIRARVEAACARRGVAVPMTPPSSKFPQGQVQVDKDALELTDDPHLHVLAAQMTFAKHLGQWGPVLRAAVHRPVCSRYDIAETGRTTCSGSEEQEGTNIQNPPRKGDVRPAIWPRRGWVFVSTDADTIELRAHAQNCLELVGWSKMAEALWDQHRNHGPDLHVRLAANILGLDAYEAHRRKADGDVEVADARQFSKIPNFGFPGGLGEETMIAYAAGQLDRETHRKWFGETREEQVAKASWLRRVWFDTWPENRPYFKVINDIVRAGGVVRQLMSNRIRGDVRFTAAANGFFQARVADAMREVLVDLADECYTGRCTAGLERRYSSSSGGHRLAFLGPDRRPHEVPHVHGGSNLCTVHGRSVLFGSRPVMFLHDEPIVEHPEDGTESDRADRQQQIVVAALGRWMPDVPTTSSAVMTRRWFKGAEPLRVGGKLVPVRPEKVKKADGRVKVTWVHDVGEPLAAAA